MIRYEYFFTDFRTAMDKQFIKSRASILIYNYTGLGISYEELIEEDVEYINIALKEYRNEHNDEEIFFYKIMHITNVIRKRDNMKPLAVDDIVHPTIQMNY